MLPRHRALTLAIECLACALLLLWSVPLALIAGAAVLVHLVVITSH